MRGKLFVDGELVFFAYPSEAISFRGGSHSQSNRCMRRPIRFGHTSLIHILPRLARVK